MATTFLSTAKALFLPSHLSSSSLTTAAATPNVRISSSSLRLNLCKATSQTPSSSPALTKRNLALSLTATFSLLLTGNANANAAILEADDDLELLEKVKQDRKKRLEQQEIISSADSEKANLQELVYKLSKVGQAIENNDLPTASSVLSPSNNKKDWLQKVNEAFTKLSLSAEEKTEVDTFNSSLSSLISSVTQNDIKSAKIAFLSSAVALEKWTVLTGLVSQLKGI